MDDQQHRQQQLPRPTDAIRSILPDKAPSSSQMVALVILVPIAAFLLFLAGIALTGSLIGLAVSTPVFVIFSPVLVPAALVIALAVAGFLMSGAFGITALSSLSWMASNLRRLCERLPGQMEQLKGRVQETAGQVGEKTKEAGQALQSKAQEGGSGEERGEAHEGGRAQEGGGSGEGGEAQEGGKVQERERSGGEAQKGRKAQEAQKGGKAQERGRTGEGGEAQKGGRAEEGASPHSRKK